MLPQEAVTNLYADLCKHQHIMKKFMQDYNYPELDRMVKDTGDFIGVLAFRAAYTKALVLIKQVEEK